MLSQVTREQFDEIFSNPMLGISSDKNKIEVAGVVKTQYLLWNAGNLVGYRQGEECYLSPEVSNTSERNEQFFIVG